ncbi:MAG: HD domain-containing protein [Burkholderiales bacterium]|nr:HD domain-containing protein [Burkholderiales bacterium]
MHLKAIEVSDIAIGAPLLWNVYDFDHNLLLRKGKMIDSKEQLEEMADRGLLIEAHFADNLVHTRVSSHSAVPRQEAPAPKPKEIPSAMRLIHAANRRLERLLYGLQTEENAQAHFLEVASVIASAVDINPDVALASILLNQDDIHYSVRHGVDTAILALSVARAMQKTPEEITPMVAAALTMNVGMLRQLDTFLVKLQPLAESERVFILAHPKASVELLKQAGVDNQEWLAHVMQHHENEDGNGYPNGKEVQSLPQTTKILSFADRYCACVSKRQYRRTFIPAAAMREALFAGGKPRDPLIAAYFVRLLTNYPPGTMVKLHNGEIGVVIARAKEDKPIMVQSVVGARGEPLSIPLLRDTSKPNFAVIEAVSREHAVLRFGMHQLFGNDAAL